MQNLTSRYNIIYNANELLKESVTNIETSTADNYDNILPVYKVPTEEIAQSEFKNLDSIIKKANVIISDKSQGNYVDDAYMLIGKANYFKANYFNAAEYFRYVNKTYRDDPEQREISWLWLGHSLLNLDNKDEAAPVLDSALRNVSLAKKNAADVFATEAQFNIKTGNELYAIEMLQKALKAGTTGPKTVRWKFILAQLQEKNNQLKEAYENYSAVVKSNASFELAFNAQLNRIRIEDADNKQAGNKVQHLKALLRADKNEDFKDQIYYRIGDVYLQNNETSDAIENYNLAVKNSVKNQTQKGLAYYRLAEINFKNTRYSEAKSYYDSTLANLPPTYPGYTLIEVKSKNLDLLADRYSVISREDTLQAFAQMPEALRDLRIGALVREQIGKVNSPGTATPDVFIAAIDNPTSTTGNAITEGKFYFNNTTALSQGFSDFKRRWGNRKLGDNWRIGDKSSQESTATAASAPNQGLPTGNIPVPQDEASLIKSYRDALPLTPVQLEQSNQKIATAYFDIGNFYRDELKDDAEAINTYQEILRRFPQSSYRSSVLYNLYRLYQTKDPEKSNHYKELLLREFPDSPFAKIITDPDYSQKANEKTAKLLADYNAVYNLYLQKKYVDVISGVTIIQQDGKNQFSPQLGYLKALAIGHTQRLPALEEAFRQIATEFPDDKIITPLVAEHLQFLDKNRDEIGKRPVALVDFDPNEPRFVEEPTAQPATAQVKQQANNIPAQAQPANLPPAKAEQKPADLPKPAANKMFSLPDSAEYYFAINVLDAGVNLSSSRFGIGQFNRANFSGNQIKHQLKDVNNENQLIFVGKFLSLSTVKDYERNILPLIRDIMKIAPDKYNTFVITNDGLNKLTDRNMINLYIDFYKQQP
ncbi:tetratricopeptide repeat protein [Pedobacter sp. HMF7647]|uniref:Tetratricopeptide repeat protein n=1 Tax=Hufsiella arboris TaxID=2695275 RepID=A0A7K1Y458_9SPHI|nr:tetratricopeptide repeat protein [Hufsiella arboris]MXV49362.1 tetratricopeptide repeat protein [Hufsiella arboris]